MGGCFGENVEYKIMALFFGWVILLVFYKDLSVVMKMFTPGKHRWFLYLWRGFAKKSWYFLIVFCWGSVDFNWLYFWCFLCFVLLLVCGGDLYWWHKWYHFDVRFAVSVWVNHLHGNGKKPLYLVVLCTPTTIYSGSNIICIVFDFSSLGVYYIDKLKGADNTKP